MASKLKICIFTETYYPVIGGGETQTRLLAEGLASRGHKVTIVTRRSDASLQKVERYGEITVYRLPPSGGQHYRKWGLLFSGFAALAQLHRDYDLIFVSGFRVIGVSAILVSKIFGKVCILKSDNNGEMSGKFFSGGLLKYGLNEEFLPFKIALRFRNRLLRSAHAFVAISKEIEAEFSDYGGVPASKIIYIPNSVDIKAFYPVPKSEKEKLKQSLGLPTNVTLVIYTGRLVSYKGLPLLLKAWKEIQAKYEKVLLLLVGSASNDIFGCEQELKDFVNANDLRNTVWFVGEVQGVSKFLKASDIFVFPTEKEAFGISLIEAMACALPVISTPVGGIKDFLKDKKNGLLVTPGDLNGLYIALEQLILDRSLATRLAAEALKNVKDSFSDDIVTDKYIELFIKLAYQRGGKQIAK